MEAFFISGSRDYFHFYPFTTRNSVRVPWRSSTKFDSLISFPISACPDLEKPLSDILDRLVNLLPWLQSHYYHPAMKGSWSIKAVLPTIGPHLDYSQLEDVQNGTLAQLAYLDIINPETVPAVRDEKICNLLKYCELDTQAMVEVVRFFRGSVTH